MLIRSILIRPMRIRPLLDPDVPAAAALLRASALAYILHESTSDEADAFLPEHDEDGLRGRLADGYAYHAAVLDDGRLAGFIGIRAGSHVFHLFVDAACQRRGVARRLWTAGRDAALASAGAAHPGAFTVNASNHAVPFYEALGFVRTAPMQVAGVRYNPMRLDPAPHAAGSADFLAAPQP